MNKRRLAKEEIFCGEKGMYEKAKSIDAANLLLNWVWMLSSSFDENPEFYRNERKKELWLIYSNVSISIEEFADMYGLEAAIINDHYPFTIYGMAEELDLAQLDIWWEEDERIHFRKQNSKGEDFEYLKGLGLKWRVTDEVYEVFSKLFASLDYRCPYLAISRSDIKKLPELNKIPHIETDTYYVYLQMDEESESPFLNALTMEQKIHLWLKFIRDGISPLEFGYINEYRDEQDLHMFEWELALYMALDRQDMKIDYEDPGFKIVDSGGKRYWFSHQSVLEAEKLFMKILFPVIPVDSSR